MNKGRSPALDIMSKRELDFTVFANDVFAELRKDEELSLSMNAEDSTFVRFNGAKIRQTEFLCQEVRIFDGRITKFFDDGNRNADQ